MKFPFYRRFLKITGWFAFVTLLFYTGICIFMFFFQKNFIFFPSQNIGYIPEPKIQEIFFKTPDNKDLHGWYLDNNAQKTVLFFHGNAGNISRLKTRLEMFQKLHVNALVFDYRGYGKSSGEIQQESDIYTDANSALTYLQEEKHISLENIILWGHSLGGAVAIEIAQNKKIFAVIVESSFSSLDDMARKDFWYLPTHFILRFHFKSTEKIPNISSKILIVHSLQDEMIPFSQSEELFKRANNPKQFFKISGAHNDGWYNESFSLYFQTLQEFLQNTP